MNGAADFRGSEGGFDDRFAMRQIPVSGIMLGKSPPHKLEPQGCIGVSSWGPNRDMRSFLFLKG
jgi:hypothetical protein